jgi:hypothetical protein
MKYTKPELTPLGDAAHLIESTGTGHESDMTVPGPIQD